MGLTDSRFVESLEIHRPAGGSILLWANYHSGAPGHRFIQGDGLQHPQATVAVKFLLYLLLPVDGDGDGRVDGHWCLGGVDMESEGRKVSDEGEFLVTALIEC